MTIKTGLDRAIVSIDPNSENPHLYEPVPDLFLDPSLIFKLKIMFESSRLGYYQFLLSIENYSVATCSVNVITGAMSIAFSWSIYQTAKEDRKLESLQSKLYFLFMGFYGYLFYGIDKNSGLPNIETEQLTITREDITSDCEDHTREIQNFMETSLFRHYEFETSDDGYIIGSRSFNSRRVQKVIRQVNPRK